jgi:molybdenum cofactor biosynthesis enzyme MoaA
MTQAIAERVIEVLSRSSSVETVDLTGGAPELNPNFAYLVHRARQMSRVRTPRAR